MPHPALLAQPLRYDSFLGGGGGGGSATPLSWEFLGGANNTSDHIFNGMDFGAVSGDRHLIAAFGWGNGSTNTDVTAVMIGGVAASKVCDSVVGASTLAAEIWIANVAAGASGDVEITSTGGAGHPQFISLGLYRASGLSSASPVDSDAAVTSSFSTLTFNLAAHAGGFAVGAVIASSGTQPHFSELTIDQVWPNVCEVGSLETPETGNFVVTSPSGTARRAAVATWF